MTEEVAYIDRLGGIVDSWFYALEERGGTVGDGVRQSAASAGLLAQRLRESYGTAMVDHQPGNGTRYLIIVTELRRIHAGEDLEPDATDLLGSDGFLVTVPSLSTARPMVVGRYDLCTPEWVHRHFAGHAADAVHLAAVLSWFTGAEASSS